MLKSMFFAAACLVAQLLLLVSDPVLATEPVNHAAVLTPYVNDDTFAVGYLDAASLNATNLGELFSMLPKLPDEAQSEMLGLMMASGWIKSFQNAGGQGAYVLAGLSDIHFGGGPLLVATTQPGKRPEDVEQMISTTIRQIMGNQSQAANGPIVRRKDDLVLVGTKSTISRYDRFQPAARNELIAPLTKLTSDGAVAAVVFCPGADYRRVSRELWPELPGALAPLRGELADRWLHFEAAVNLPPNPNPRIALQAKDDEAAAIFVKLFRDLPSAADSFKEFGSAPPEVKQMLETIVEAIPRQQVGARVTLTLSTDEQHLTVLRKILARALNAAQESSRRKERMNRFRGVSIAMLNYSDEYKCLPPTAIRDKDGKPLLSWRVAILPFLEEGKLYKQFHFDEPWDSPHNRALIEKMPSSYGDPDPNFTSLARHGKTMVQVPTGPDTIFYHNEATTFREISDGTSHTVLVIEVEPSRAVVWTKPEDWEVDIQNPLRGIERTDRRYITAAFADGHVSAIPTDEKLPTLRAILTRAGGENVQTPPY